MTKDIKQNTRKRHPDAKLFDLENDLRAAVKKMAALSKLQTIADNKRGNTIESLRRRAPAVLRVTGYDRIALLGHLDQGTGIFGPYAVNALKLTKSRDKRVREIIAAGTKHYAEIPALEAAYEKADKPFMASISAAVAIVTKIQKIKPRTLDGVLIQLRALLWDSASTDNYDHVATPKIEPICYADAIEPDRIVAAFHNIARINSKLAA